MMIHLSKFGVTLRTMQEEDLELVRMQRNRPDMRALMTTDHEITREEMENWFKSLPQDYYYFMVEWEGRIVGQVNLKGIDNLSADPGFIFWDDEFSLNGGVARAVFLLYICAFDSLHYEYLKGLTLIENRKAMRLAKGFGFKQVGEEIINGKTFARFELNRQAFEDVKAMYLPVFSTEM